MTSERASVGSAQTPVVSGLIAGQKVDGRVVYNTAAKRELAQLCMKPGVSVSRTAMVNGVNANVLRKWIAAEGTGGKQIRKKKVASDPMVPVVIKPHEDEPVPVAAPLSSRIGIEIELAHGRVWINSAEAGVVRSVIELLRGR